MFGVSGAKHDTVFGYTSGSTAIHGNDGLHQTIHVAKAESGGAMGDVVMT